MPSNKLFEIVKPIIHKWKTNEKNQSIQELKKIIDYGGEFYSVLLRKMKNMPKLLELENTIEIASISITQEIKKDSEKKLMSFLQPNKNYQNRNILTK